MNKIFYSPVWFITFIIVALVGLVGAIVLVNGVGSGPTSIATYRKATYQVPDGIEPSTAFSTAENAISNLLYEGLFTVSKSLEIKPALIDSWQLDKSGELYTFRVKAGIFFHDGTPLVANDVARMLNQLLDVKSPVRLRYSRIQEVTVVDDQTVQVRLRSHYPPFIALLAAPAAKIVKRIEGRRYPIGTGGFQFRAINQEDGHKVLILDRFEKYHGTQPYIKVLKLVEVTEPEAIAGLKSGVLLDSALMPYLGAGKMTEKDRSLEVTQPAAVTWILALNTSKAPTSDKNLRACLVRSFRREQFVKKFIPEQEVAFGLLPPTLMGSGKVALKYSPSEEDCKTFSGSTISLDYPSELNRGEEMCREMATYFEKTGLVLNCRGVPYETLISNIRAGTTHISFLSQTLDLPDVEYFVETFESNAPLNLSNYHSRQFDDLLTRARTEPDREHRASIFEKIDQELFDNSVTLNISYAPHISYWNKCLSGVEVSIAGESYIDYSKIAGRRGCKLEQAGSYGQ